MNKAPTLEKPLDGARYCAEKGLRVFPLRHGSKLPMLEGWQDWATTEKWQIEKFAASNTDCNWGIYCGGSGVFAVDLDVKDGKNGIEEWSKLTSANPTADTLAFRTPTGGIHLIFRGMERSTASSLAPGIDTRGQGGYIVAPGSLLVDKASGDEVGRYTVTSEQPIEPLPAWISSTFGTRKEPLKRPEGQDTLDSIPSGERDNTLARWAGSLRSAGLEEAEVYAALTKMNELRCSPPLGDADVKRISRSISRLSRPTASAVNAFATEKTPVAPIKAFSLAAIRAREIPQPEQVISEFADVGDTLGIFGKSKAKKSWAALQLAMSLAMGRSFAGLEIRKPRRTLLLQLEVTKDHFERRTQKVLGAFGPVEEDLLGNLRIAHGRGQGLTLESIADLVAVEKPECLIIDPLYTLIPEENAAEGVKPVIGALARIAETGVFVAYTHHDKKGKSGDLELVDRGSGSGVIGRAYDAAMFIDPSATDPEAQVLRFITRNYPPIEDLSVRWSDYLFREHDAPAVVETTGTAHRDAVSKSWGPSVEILQAEVEKLVEGRAEVAQKEIRVFLDNKGVGSRKRLAVIERMTTPPFGEWMVKKGPVAGSKLLIRESEV